MRRFVRQPSFMSYCARKLCRAACISNEQQQASKSHLEGVAHSSKSRTQLQMSYLIVLALTLAAILIFLLYRYCLYKQVHYMYCTVRY